MKKGKIGIGVVTYNRQDYCERVLKTVPNVGPRVVVNDGTPYDESVYPEGWEVITHKENKCVAAAKNTALRYLISQGCEYLFIIEDDILIKDDEVFERYIDAANITGLHHLMYAYHGPANKYPSQDHPKPRLAVKFKEEGDDNSIWFNTHCVGGFCYYHAGVIKNVGYMDENFKNAWEHVEHSYRIVKAGILPAYWWWPDIAESPRYLDEIACSEESSVIRPRADWASNIQTGMRYFKELHGYSPVEITETSHEEIFKKLEFIKTNYSRAL